MKLLRQQMENWGKWDKNFVEAYSMLRRLEYAECHSSGRLGQFRKPDLSQKTESLLAQSGSITALHKTAAG